MQAANASYRCTAYSLVEIEVKFPFDFTGLRGIPNVLFLLGTPENPLDSTCNCLMIVNKTSCCPGFVD
jgi:hypothetical protein